MNFVDTTVYEEKRFEIKQNLVFNEILANKSFIFNIWTCMIHAQNPSNFKRFIKIRHLRKTKDS